MENAARREPSQENLTEVVVSTEWVEAHLKDPTVRIIESNEDPLLYKSGHIPGAVEVDWVVDLNDRLRRDYLEGAQFSALMSRLGVTRHTTIVLYGDKNNWWATYALWVFKLFGHPRVMIMDGGSLKWKKEGRPLSREVPSFPATDYPIVHRHDQEIRAFRDEVMHHQSKRGQLIDVRSPDEFSGAKLHMENYPNEGALRGGHIPGAKNVPWAKAVDPNTGTFLPRVDLEKLYCHGLGFSPHEETVTYCRIGERSSHTWFVLKYLLGFERVKNYDGSWTEWGNLVGAPIER